MGKRGRKPKEHKGYFYEEEENAIIKYIETTDEAEKNRLFNETIYPALTKMIESIIRRYKLFVPDEEFDQNFCDTISYLLTKIHHFRPVITSYEELLDSDQILKHEYVEITPDVYKLKARNAEDSDPQFIKVDFPNYSRYFKKVTHKYKAYSYCGTVCKNYLMYKCSQYVKNKQRHEPYEELYDEITNSNKYTVEQENSDLFYEKLVTNITDEIEDMVKNSDKYGLSENEVIVGNALIDLMKNWDQILQDVGSNKLQKSKVLYYLRETTYMTTKEIRENMKQFKKVYYAIKNDNLIF